MRRFVSKLNIALAEMALRQPRKILAMWRMRTAVRRLIAGYYQRTDGFVPHPATIALRLTYRCNLRCIHCNQWGMEGAIKEDSADLRSQELELDDWKRLLEEAAPFRPHIYFTGGEPLMLSRLPQLVEHASRLGLVTRVGTNCTLLDRQADDLLRAGLDIVFLSLDGPPGVNDLIRRGPHSFDRALAGIRALQSARRRWRTRLPILRVQSVITTENHLHLWEMAQFVENEIRPEIWALMPGIFNTPAQAAATNLMFQRLFGREAAFAAGYVRDVSGIDAQKVQEQVERIRRTKWSFQFYPYEPMGFREFSCRDYYFKPDQFIGGVFCCSPFVMTQVHPNGDVATCSRFSDFIAGSIREQPLLEIWNGPRYREFRAFVKGGLFPVCTRCQPLYNLLGRVGRLREVYALPKGLREELP